jgi:hypothetical protein
VIGPSHSTSAAQSPRQHQHSLLPPPLGHLLRKHQVQQSSPQPHVHLGEGSVDRVEGRSNWLPKMNFPVFDGTDARIWIDKCVAYFGIYQIPQGFRVSVASIHMTSPAAPWVQAYKHTIGFQNWDTFVSVVLAEFEVDTHRAKTMELLNLRQTGSLEEYKRQFEQLVYHIRLSDNSLSTTMLLHSFCWD